MTGLLCAMVLLAGFPEERDADFRFMSTPRYDGDWRETEDVWFGLFEKDSGFVLREVELELSRSTAPLYEGERPHPVIVKLVDEPDWPLIIVSSSSMEFTEGTVSTAFHGNQLLAPDTSIALEGSGIRRTVLSATEEGLFLTNSDSSLCQMLSDTYPGEHASENFLEAVWAGDLDRDGSVDLIINDVDDGYLRYRWILFLSSGAHPDTLLEMVASFCDVYY